MDYSDHYSNPRRNKEDEDQTELLMNNLMNHSPRWINAIAETRNNNGHGHGNGHGNGHGSGNGHGNANGHGSGNGNGHPSGYGILNGHPSGYGVPNGHGNSNGNANTNGHGSGYSNGHVSNNGHATNNSNGQHVSNNNGHGSGYSNGHASNNTNGLVNGLANLNGLGNLSGYGNLTSHLNNFGSLTGHLNGNGQGQLAGHGNNNGHGNTNGNLASGYGHAYGQMQPNNDMYSNFMDGYGNNSHNTFRDVRNNGLGSSPQSLMDYGAIGQIIGYNTNMGSQLTPSTSPHSTASTESYTCGHCDTGAISRCVECNDVFCESCAIIHKNTESSKDHFIVGMNKTITPIGSFNPMQFSDVPALPTNELKPPQCEMHGENMIYLCDVCKIVVCQECTIREHKDHKCVPINSITSDSAREKLTLVYESSKLGIKFIKSSIDRAVAYSQSVERDSSETASRIRKAMRHFIVATEDRERVLQDQVDKFRQQKLTSLSDQMTGLRAALSGLAQTSDKLNKSIVSVHNMSTMTLLNSLTTAESQIQKYAAMYKGLQPKEEFITFVTPNYELLSDIRIQGEIIMNVRVPAPVVNNSNKNAHASTAPPQNVASTSSPQASARRPIVRNVISRPSFNDVEQFQVDQQYSRSSSSNVTPIMTYASICKPAPIRHIPNQCVNGSLVHVSAKPIVENTNSFACDGNYEGFVSRPWGICVNKNNEIIVADRRNNRIQIYLSDGNFKFQFGCKGTGNGQFDLPAGICTDANNQIVVVDKDNHRIQLFTEEGEFVLKFGTFGKECGQFQYPWDVAVNSIGNFLISDSRNHRIQLFNRDGHFISRFSFDGINHSRYLKGLTTPRGVCFTPEGDIIITDFENHRLILIDGDMTRVLAAKGHEGAGMHEFCRPSGICCDDDGRVIVADSKNQRVVTFSSQLEFLWATEIRPTSIYGPFQQGHQVIDDKEKDRPSDVALLLDGRLIVLVETSPDSRDQCSKHKTFVQIY